MKRLLLLVLGAMPAAAVTITLSGGTSSSVPGLTSTINFAGQVATDPSGIASYGLTGDAGFNVGTGLGTGDFLSVNSGGQVTINFSQPLSYFGLNWSTTDSYNTIQFFNGATAVAGPFTGSGVSGGFTTTYVNFAFAPNEIVNRIVLASTGCCFESDNHAFIVAVPEPGTWALLLPGLAWAVLQRRRSA